MSSESRKLRGALRHWQEIDRRLNLGEFDADDVSRASTGRSAMSGASTPGR